MQQPQPPHLRISTISGAIIYDCPSSSPPHPRSPAPLSPFDKPLPFSKKLPHSPRPYASNKPQYFTFSPSQQLPIPTTTPSPLLNQQESAYTPLSPLQLWKVGREDLTDEGCFNDATDTTPLCDQDSLNSLTITSNSDKEMVTPATHSTTNTTPLVSPPLPTNAQNATAKKRGQVRYTNISE